MRRPRRLGSASLRAEAIELHILIRANRGTEITSHLVELLTIVAHFHRTGCRLGLGHTVNFGRPWIPGASCAFGLISLPYQDGPPLEWMNSPLVRFLWLVPITETEREFKKKYGLEALEERFERVGLDYLESGRKSVV